MGVLKKEIDAAAIASVGNNIRVTWMTGTGKARLSASLLGQLWQERDGELLVEGEEIMVLRNRCEDTLDKRMDLANYRKNLGVHENRKRTHIGNQTVRGGFHGEELVVCSFHSVSLGGIHCGDALEPSLGRQDCLQSFYRAAHSPAVCDLSRSTASGDLAPFALGRWLDENLWDSGPQPQQHLAKLAQPSSHSQLQAPGFSYWLLSHHDQSPVFEVIEGQAF
jgi:hypothetical protein